MKLNLTMLLRIMEIIGVDVNDNKPGPEYASHDNVDDFNEDTCEVWLYDVENVVHSTEDNVEVQDNMNYHNDDKTVDVENEVESDNAPENNVGGVF